MAPQNKDPISLENLPQYLASVRENGERGGSPIVGTGQIIVPQKRSWFEKTAFAMVACVILSIGSMITYNYLSTKQFTVVVDVQQNADIPKIVSDSGGKIIAMKQNEDLTYEVKLSTRKSERSFLEWLRGNKEVKKAELDN